MHARTMVSIVLARVFASVFFNFETIAGTEFRRVDPNQANYVLDMSVFGRLPRGELGATFHHVSRHLTDRANRQGISWNMLGVVYGDRLTLGGVDIRASSDESLGTVVFVPVGGPVQRSRAIALDGGYIDALVEPHHALVVEAKLTGASARPSRAARIRTCAVASSPLT